MVFLLCNSMTTELFAQCEDYVAGDVSDNNYFLVCIPEGTNDADLADILTDVPIEFNGEQTLGLPGGQGNPGYGWIITGDFSFIDPNLSNASLTSFWFGNDGKATLNDFNEMFKISPPIEQPMPYGTWEFTGFVYEDRLSDGSFVCQDITPNSILVEYWPGDSEICASCPVYDLSVSDCMNGEFTVLFNVTDMKGYEDFEVTVDGNSELITQADNYEYGPFTAGKEVFFTIINLSQPLCNVNKTLTNVCLSCDNDECMDAVNITDLLSDSGKTMNMTASFDNTECTTSAGEPAAPSCFQDGPELKNTMWFTFKGNGDSYFIETSDCAGEVVETYIDLGDTQMAVYSGDCGNLTQIACNENSPNVGQNGPFMAGLTVDTEAEKDYYLMIDGNSGASGQFCLNVTRRLNCGSEDLLDALATATVNGTEFCFGDTLFMSFDTPLWPDDSEVAGYSWVMTIEDISNTNDLKAEFSDGGSGLIAYAASQNDPPSRFEMVNHNMEFDFSFYLYGQTFYVTPVILGNAVDPSPGNPPFLTQLDFDPNCTFVGESVEILFYLDNVAECSGDCPFASFDKGDCVDGEYTIDVNIEKLGIYNSVLLTDNKGYSKTINSEQVLTLGPYASTGETITLKIITSDTDCDIEQDFFFGCPAECDILNNGNFEAGFESWDVEAGETPFSVICDSSCTTNGSSNFAYEGDFWCWFIPTDTLGTNEITVKQTVQIPVGSGAALQFYLYVGSGETGGTGESTLDVSIDNTNVYSVDDSQVNGWGDWYHFIRVPIPGSMQDGDEHTLTFKGTMHPQNVGVFLVDAVEIDACGEPCEPIAGSISGSMNTEMTKLTASVSGEQNATGYAYVFLLVDGDNIKAQNQTGIFDNMDSGTYKLYGLSVRESGLGLVQSTSTIAALEGLMAQGFICGVLTSGDNYEFTQVGIGPVNNNPDFAIHSLIPNPAHNQTLLQYTYSGSDRIEINIFDITGKRVQSQTVIAHKGNNSLTLNIDDLNNGVYFLYLKAKADVIVTKLVKQ